MKRIATLAVAAVLLLGAVGQAFAATEVRVEGKIEQAFGWVDGQTFSHVNEDDFQANTRLRAQVEFIASEALRGVYAFEVGTINWGRPEEGGALDTTGVNVATRFLYIDWQVPNTDLTFRMGLQELTLPWAVSGNPVFDANVAAVVGTYKFNDMVSLTAFWARPFDNYGWYNAAQNNPSYDAMDMFGLIVPITGETWDVSPWFTYANIGGDSGFWNYRLSDEEDFSRSGLLGSADTYVGGVAVNLNMFDPLSLKFDGMYGDISNDHDQIESRGWYLAAAADYKFDWVTPGIFGWWASGDDADAAKDNDYGRLPVIGSDGGVFFSSFGFGGNESSVTTSNVIGLSPMGTWGAGVQAADLSFLKDLSHTVRLLYYQGTNNSENVRYLSMNPGVVNLDNVSFMGEFFYMTNHDNAWEVNVDSKYQVYENLIIYLELGYIRLDMDKGVWGDTYDQKNAWKGQAMFQYNF